MRDRFYKRIFTRGKLLVPAYFLLCTAFLTGCSNTERLKDVNVTEITETIAESLPSETATDVAVLPENEVIENTDVSETSEAVDGKVENTTGNNENEAKKDEAIMSEMPEGYTRIEKTTSGSGYKEGEPMLSSLPEITYEYSDDYYDYYSFDYTGKVFEVLHEYDNWKIFDSYKIRNSEDMQLICEALLEIYPVHGADLESYRTPEDMAYEWI